MVVCLVATLGVTAANLRLTYVTDSNGARQVLLTDADASPAQVMHLSGIRSEEGDEVYYTAFSGNLASLNIERAFSVSITADGQEYPVKLVFGTVADALERAGITLEGDDYTEPALDHVVTAGSKIVVHRVDYAERVETQAIPYDTQYVYTSLYFRNTGRTTTVQHGAAGQQTVTTRDRYVDGELENSTVVDTTTTVEPTDHVIKTYGAGAPVSPLTGADGTTNAPTSYSKDPALREQNVALMERMIRLASIFGPQRLVLHPSSEPIADEEREIRLQNSANSIGRLALSAKEIGAVLCIENLPRTCLGRDSGELMRLIADYPEVMVCFDSNHLLKEEHAHFFEAVGNRIGTIHASDYDRKDERHWLPGEGVIDWSDFLRRLQASGYKGVFMHEVRAGETATPDNIVKTYNEVILGNKKK